MVATIGRREAEVAIQKGTLYSAVKALDIGLVDELCPASNLMDRANDEVQKWLAVPGWSNQILQIKH